MPAAGNLVAAALRAALGTLPGEGIDGGEAEHALGVVNGLLAAWSADGLLPNARTLEPFALTAAQPTYTIGPGGQMNTARPDAVKLAFRRDPSGSDTPLELMTRERWAGIAAKTTPGLPEGVYYDPTSPLGTLHVWPVPDTPCTLFLDGLKPLPQFSGMAAVLTLPGEYAEPLKYLAAERLCVDYGMPVSRDLAKLVASSKAALRKHNARPRPARFDPALRGCRPTSMVTG